jgi:signal recognition particle receptor subunit alpha
MLDAVVAFTRGGEVLWRWKGGSKSTAAGATNAPLDALVRSCLLEDRASEASFAWDAPGVGGGSYTLKWSLHNVSEEMRRRRRKREREKEKEREEAK